MQKRWTFSSLIFFIVLIAIFVIMIKSGNSNSLAYYGADIGQFPQKIRYWIIEEAFPKEKIEGKAIENPELKAWWSSDGNAVNFEASYTISEGYLGAGKRTIWGTSGKYGGSDLKKYGKYKKYHTLKFKYWLKLENEKLIKTDPAFAEIIAFAKELSGEIEYDWSSFSGYRGVKPIKTPGMKYAVCSGYSNEVMQKALSLKYVDSVEEWTSSNHSWNVLNLTDGRRLYFDLTWFDNEYIDHKTGKTYQLDDYKWGNITFDKKVFDSHMSYSGSFPHAAGSFKRVLGK